MSASKTASRPGVYRNQASSRPFAALLPDGGHNTRVRNANGRCDRSSGYLLITPDKWLNICHQAQAPLITSQTCMAPPNKTAATTVVTADTEIPWEAAGKRLSDVDLSGPDAQGNLQNQVITACHDVDIRQKMAAQSAQLRATWTDIHKTVPLLDQTVNRDYLSQDDRKNSQQLRSAHMARAFDIIKRAKDCEFYQRDEIKTLNRGLGEVDGMIGRQKNTELLQIIKKKRDEQDLAIFNRLVEADQDNVARDKQTKMDKMAQEREWGILQREDADRRRNWHAPPLRHHFPYLHAQADRIRRHNQELRQEQEDIAREESKKGFVYRDMLDEQQRVDSQVQRKEDQARRDETYRQRAYVKLLIDRIQNIKQLQSEEEGLRTDKYSPVQIAAEKRKMEAAEELRLWEDANGQAFYAYLADYDAKENAKQQRRKKELDINTVKILSQLAENEEARKEEQAQKLRDRRRIDADVAAFREEEQIKAHKFKYRDRDLARTHRYQAIEREERDQAEVDERAKFARAFRDKARTDKNDFLDYASSLIAEKEQIPDSNIFPLEQARDHVLNTAFKSVK